MRIYFITLAILAASVSFAQQKPPKSDPTSGNPASGTAAIDGTNAPKTPKTGPKPYKEVITDKAITNTGLFTVHKVEEKYYFEIADSIMAVSYTHLRAHETVLDLVCRLLLEKNI